MLNWREWPVNKLMFTFLFFTILSFLFLSSALDAKGMEGGSEKEKKLLLILVDGFSFSAVHAYQADPFFAELLRSGYLGAMTMRTLGGKGVEDEIATLVMGRRAKGERSLFHPFLKDEGGAFYLFPLLRGKGAASYGEGIGARLHEAGLSTALFLPAGQMGGPSAPFQGVSYPGVFFLGDQNKPRKIDSPSRVGFHPGAPFVVDRNGWGRMVNAGGGKAGEVRGIRFLVTEWHRGSERPWMPFDRTREKERFLSFLGEMVHQFHEDREIWILPYRLDEDSVSRGAYLSPFLILPRATGGDLIRRERKEVGKDAEDRNEGGGMAEERTGDAKKKWGSKGGKNDRKDTGQWEMDGYRQVGLVDRHQTGQGGILTSPTTRRHGFIGNIDLYPSILAYFGLEDSLREGRPMVRVGGAARQNEVLREVDRSIEMHQMRRPFLFRLLFWMVGGMLLLLLLSRVSSLRLLLHFLALSLLTIPLLLLLFPLFHLPASLPVYEGGLLFGVTLLSFLLLHFDMRRRYLLIASLYVSLFFLDGVLGATMLSHSVLSYDPIIAARFYGIGNEYAGVLLGSGLLLLFLIASKEGNPLDRTSHQPMMRKGVLLFLYLSILVYFAHPGLGADFGGALSWLGLSLFTVLRNQKDPPLSMRGLYFAGLLLLFVLPLLFLYLWGIAYAENSHLGRLMAQASDRGIGVILEVVERKLEMNIKLLLHSMWNRLFLLSSLLLAGYLYAAKRWGIGRRGGAELARSSLWVNLAGFAFNDSGIVTASLGFLFAVVPLLDGLFARKEGSDPVR